MADSENIQVVLTPVSEFARLTPGLVVRLSEISSYQVISPGPGVYRDSKTVMVIRMKSGAEHTVIHDTSSYASPPVDVYGVARYLDRKLGVG